MTSTLRFIVALVSLAMAAPALAEPTTRLKDIAGLQGANSVPLIG